MASPNKEDNQLRRKHSYLVASAAQYIGPPPRSGARTTSLQGHFTVSTAAQYRGSAPRLRHSKGTWLESKNIHTPTVPIRVNSEHTETVHASASENSKTTPNLDESEHQHIEDVVSNEEAKALSDLSYPRAESGPPAASKISAPQLTPFLEQLENDALVADLEAGFHLMPSLGHPNMTRDNRRDCIFVERGDSPTVPQLPPRPFSFELVASALAERMIPMRPHMEPVEAGRGCLNLRGLKSKVHKLVINMSESVDELSQATWKIPAFKEH